MQIVQSRSRVGPDGVLHLDVPLGPADAGREVIVTIQPVPPPMTTDEWQRFVAETAGSVDDPLFRRHEQGELQGGGDRPKLR